MTLAVLFLVSAPLTVKGVGWNVHPGTNSLTIQQGLSTTTTTTIHNFICCSGIDFLLTAGSSPYGLTFSFSNNGNTPSGSVCPQISLGVDSDGSCTMNVDASGASPNNYVVTVYAWHCNTSACDSYSSDSPVTATISVQVTDFVPSASTPSPTEAGSPSASTITVTAAYGFSGTVAFAQNAGTVCYLSSGSITLSSTSSSGSLTLTCTSLSAQNLSVTVTASSGSLHHILVIQFVFIDFIIAPTSPILLAVNSGSSGTQTVSIAPLNGFTGSVTLTANPSAGLTCQPLANVQSGSGTSTLSCYPSYGAADYTVTVTGTSGSLTHTSAVITYHVVGIKISVGSFTPNPPLAGVEANASTTVTPVNGFTGTVALSVFTNPGLTCAISPTAITIVTSSSSATSTISCSAALANDYVFNVLGTSDSLRQSTNELPFNVVDFSGIPAPNNVIVNAGSSGMSKMNLTAINGFTGTITLTQNGGALCSLSVASVTLTATMTSGSAVLSCSYANAGSDSVIVSASSGSLNHTATVTFQVQDFSVTASPTAVGVTTNQMGSSTITVTAINGFTGTVALSQDAGTGCALASSSVMLTATSTTGTSVLNCTFASSGTFAVKVTTTSGSLSHSLSVDFAVQDYLMMANPTSVTVNAGSAGVSTIIVTAPQSFSGIVTLTTNSTSCTLTPGSVTGSGSSTLTCKFSPAGIVRVTVTGTSSQLSHNVNVTYTVQDFNLTANPTAVAVNAGTAGTSTLTITALQGFSLGVSLVTNSTSCTIALATISGSGTATLSCTFTSAGTVRVSITGMSGSLLHLAIATFTVRDAPSAPQDIMIKPGVGQIALSWQAPSSNGGVPLTNYKIYRGTTQDSLTLLVEVSNNTLTFTDTSLDSRRTYFYQVSAVNSVGESPKAPQTVSPVVTLPPPTSAPQVPWLAVAIIAAIVVGFAATVIISTRKRRP